MKQCARVIRIRRIIVETFSDRHVDRRSLSIVYVDRPIRSSARDTVYGLSSARNDTAPCPFQGELKAATDRVLSPAASFACEYSTWFIRRHALRRSDLPRSPPLCESHLLPYRYRFMRVPDEVRCSRFSHRRCGRFLASSLLLVSR